MSFPSAYKPEYVERARVLSEAGATDAEMAKEFGVAPSTLYLWKLKFPDFATAMQAGKDVADERVVRSLYNKALGYEHNGQFYPPDTTAQIFWLKNRRRKDWRDKQEVEHGGNLTVNISGDDSGVL